MIRYQSLWWSGYTWAEGLKLGRGPVGMDTQFVWRLFGGHVEDSVSSSTNSWQYEQNRDGYLAGWRMTHSL